MIDQRPRGSASSWWVVGLLAAAYTVSYLDRQVLSLLVEPIKRSLGLSDTQIGLVQGLSFSLFYVAASLPLAWIADRTRPSRVIAACIAFWSLATMLCSRAASFWQLFALRVGVAAGEAGLPPAALATLADRFDAPQLARATSIFMLAPFVGGGLALLGGGALMGAVGGWERPPGSAFAGFEDWQLVFLIVGAPGLILAALALLIVDRPRGGDAGAPPQPLSAALGFFAREWRVAGLYSLAIAVNTTLLSSYVTWLPAALMRAHGLDEAAVGILFGPVYLLAGSAGTLSAGFFVARRAGADPVASILRYLRILAILLWPAAVLGVLAPSFGLAVALMAGALFLISAINGLSSLPMQYLAPREMRAQALALLAMIAALLGTGLGPILGGVLSDRLTFAAQPLSVALALIAGVSMPIVVILLSAVLAAHRGRAADASAR